LAVSLEDVTSGFALPVILTDPDTGLPYPEYYGKILYDVKVWDPEQGCEIVVHRPIVTLRRSSLARVPKSGEKWKIQIPTEPRVDAPKETFIFERPALDGISIGYVKMELVRPRSNVP
jgi:hypothetical protein